MAGQAPIVRLLLADGRADPNYLNGGTPLVDSALGAVMWDGRLNHRIEAVRVLTRDLGRTERVVQQNGNSIDGGGTRVTCCTSREVRLPRNYLPRAGGAADLDRALWRVIGNSHNVSAALGTNTTPIEICAAGPPLSCSYVQIHPTLCFLIEVSNAGGFKRWRAEKARR